jgi:hypothetical protein
MEQGETEDKIKELTKATIPLHSAKIMSRRREDVF